MGSSFVRSIVILISGHGSNMQAICEAVSASRINAVVRAVISNRPCADGLNIARSNGLETAVVDHTEFASRQDFEVELANVIDQYEPDFVVLAGFMRILGNQFVNRYIGRLINIHPSLLPLFPGLHTHQSVLDEGHQTHGATVHFVSPSVDSGPIIAQAAVPVLKDDTVESLRKRVLAREHVLYPVAVQWLCAGDFHFENGKALLRGQVPRSSNFDELERMLC